MFTRKPSLTLAIAVLIGAAAVTGCPTGPPDPAEYGEIITEVPERLNQPFPVPQLDEPEEKTEETAK